MCKRQHDTLSPADDVLKFLLITAMEWTGSKIVIPVGYEFLQFLMKHSVDFERIVSIVRMAGPKDMDWAIDWAKRALVEIKDIIVHWTMTWLKHYVGHPAITTGVVTGTVTAVAVVGGAAAVGGVASTVVVGAGIGAAVGAVGGAVLTLFF